MDSGWRLLNPGEATDWRVCSIRLYEDRYCQGKSLSLAGARIVSSSPIPEGFDLATGCSTIWTSGTGKGEQYFGLVLPSRKKVECMRLETLEHKTCEKIASPFCLSVDCSNATMCDASCCMKGSEAYIPKKLTVQQLAGSAWVDTNPNQRTSYNSYFMTYEDAADSLSSTTKLVLLIVGVLLSTLAVASLIVIPFYVWQARRMRRQLSTLKAEIEQGVALALACEDAQWLCFVEQEWGLGGRAEQKQSLAAHCLAFVVCAIVGVVGLQLKTGDKHLEISWGLDALIMVPVAFFVTIGVFPIVRWNIKRRYRQLHAQKQTAVLGSTVVVFADQVLYKGEFGKKVQSCRMERHSEEEGTLLVITYERKAGKQKIQETLRIPLPHGPDGRLGEVQQWLNSNAEFYNPAPSMLSDLRRYGGRAAHLAARLMH